MAVYIPTYLGMAVYDAGCGSLHSIQESACWRSPRHLHPNLCWCGPGSGRAERVSRMQPNPNGWLSGLGGIAPQAPSVAGRRECAHDWPGMVLLQSQKLPKIHGDWRKQKLQKTCRVARSEQGQRLSGQTLHNPRVIDR
jgi:hypothetical protein